MECSGTMPVQYREGKTRFLDMEILVDPRVLVPRPETELLVKAVADTCLEKGLKDPFVLDVGTGSGAISAGLAGSLAGCSIIASDVSRDALCVARENVDRLGYAGRVTLAESDMFEAFEDGYFEAFDVIVSNPPYVSEEDYAGLDAWVLAEPRIALYAGVEGMDHLNRLAKESEKFLKKGGFLALEIGYDQAEKVKDKLRLCGFRDIASFKDFNGYERVIIGWKHG
ncbi:MAG: peptide chain release factor N(5)-glutamine methyltransferase [Candidatus Omnitrophota bacterium]